MKPFAPLIALSLISLPLATAQSTFLPSTTSFQGVVSVNGAPYTGTGQFKFMLVSKNPFSSTPTQAVAFVDSRVNLAIGSIALSNGGTGYTEIPEITITGGGGSGATATASVNAGVISSILVTDRGSGYTSAPTIAISPPQVAEIAAWTNQTPFPTNTDEPTQSVQLAVEQGSYTAQLGSSNGFGILLNGLKSPKIFLRVWFAPDGNGFEQLSPDFTIGSVPFSRITEAVIGPVSSATGNGANALGTGNKASGEDSTAMGARNIASGNRSTAMGAQNIASGTRSTAMGESNIASGRNSTAMGLETTASGFGSTAMGEFTTAAGADSTAMGNRTIASGFSSLAAGFETQATATCSTALGEQTTASGDQSFAAGRGVGAPSANEFSVGTFNTSYTPASSSGFRFEDRAFVIGNGASDANRSDALVIEKSGQSFFKADPGAVNGNNLADYASVIENTDASSGSDVLALKLSSSSPGSSSNFIAFFGGSANGGNGTVFGEIDGNGSGGVRFQSNGADYA